jgi:hypothetical protein
MQETRRLLATLPAPAASCRDRIEGRMCGGLRFAGLSSHSSKIGVAPVRATWQLGGPARASAECQAGRAAASCHLRLLAGSGLVRRRPARWRQGLGGARRSRRPRASESRSNSQATSARSWLAMGPGPNLHRDSEGFGTSQHRAQDRTNVGRGPWCCVLTWNWQKQIGTFPDLQANRESDSRSPAAESAGNGIPCQ